MKQAHWAIICILTTILSIALNFDAVLMGSNATLLNISVTFIYAAVWITFTTVYRKSSGVMIACTIWGLLTLLAAVLQIASQMVNFGTWLKFFGILLSVLFSTPLYGVDILNLGNISYVVISVAALIWTVSALISIKVSVKQPKKNHHSESIQGGGH